MVGRLWKVDWFYQFGGGDYVCKAVENNKTNYLYGKEVEHMAKTYLYV